MTETASGGRNVAPIVVHHCTSYLHDAPRAHLPQWRAHCSHRDSGTQTLAHWSCRTARHTEGFQQMVSAVCAAAAAGGQLTEAFPLLEGAPGRGPPSLHGHGLRVCVHGILLATAGCAKIYPRLLRLVAWSAWRTVLPMASLSDCLLQSSERALLGSPDRNSG